MASQNYSDLVKSGDSGISLQHLKQRSPNARRVLGILAVLVIGGTVLGGGALALLIASPVLLLLSPVLVPLAIVAALATGAFVAFVAFVAAIAGVYRYVKGRRLVGSQRVDNIKASATK